MGTVGVDGSRYFAVAYGVGACLSKAYESGTMYVSGNCARHLHILDSGPTDVSEGSRTLVVCVADVDSQGMSTAVELASEGMFVCAHHCRDADVCPQSHNLAAI